MKKLFVASTLAMFATAAIAHAEEKVAPAHGQPAGAAVGAPATQTEQAPKMEEAAKSEGKKKKEKKHK